MELEKIALFGGSFNPVHIGHLAIAKAVLNRGLAERVWMIPCRQNPLKHESPKYSDAERIRLLNMAIEYCRQKGDDVFNRIEVNDIELRLPSPSYTSQTLRELQRRHPDTSFILLMGADSYNDIKKWKNSDWILSNFPIIVYPRPGFEMTLDTKAKNLTVMKDVEEYNVSSTSIRKNKEIIYDNCPWLERKTQ